MTERLPGDVVLHRGDCRAVLRTLAPDTFHACATDPPYHLTSIIKRYGRTSIDGAGTNERRAKARADGMARLSAGFMGQKWDGGDIAFQPETWAAVLRVLKPGAHLVAFGAPRNVHRLTCAIEDAGFEIRDQLMWVFGVGFPKSHDAKKAMTKASDVDLFRDPLEEAKGKWEGWGTALKPAYEPIILARKPLAGTVQENLREHGCGALNINASRIPFASGADRETAHNNALGPVELFKSTKQIYDGGRASGGFADTHSPLGRWPANFLHDGSEEVVELFPDQAGALAPVRKRGADKFQNTYGTFGGHIDEEGKTFRGDSGSAARFFYCAKATKAERCGSKHPTVKPIALLRYLIRLIAPPGGLILDPFAGTGTTAQAALLEGMRAELIEREEQYQEDIRRRLEPMAASA